MPHALPFPSSPSPRVRRAIDQRQANQAARDRTGRSLRRLTGREAARLERGQRHVQNVENRTLADGTVTGREAARVEHAQDVQSRRIYRQKHDRQHDLNHDGVTDRPATAEDLPLRFLKPAPRRVFLL